MSNCSPIPAPRAMIRGRTFSLERTLSSRAFYVQQLAAEWQDGLVPAVAALFGGTAGGVSLDDVQLAQGRVSFLAIGELAGRAMPSRAPCG